MSLDLSRELRVAAPGGDAAPEVPVAPNGVLTTVGFLVAALRRRWRLWASTAALGVVAAIILSVAVPTDHTATTTMVLHHPSASDTGRAMLTDAELIKSRTVAQRAIDRLNLHMSATKLISTYRVTVLSDEILQLRMTASSPREAVRRADVVASEFLSFRREEFERQSREVVRALDERRRVLIEEFDAVSEKINSFAGSPSSGNDSAVREYGDLVTRRASLEDQIAQLRQRIDSALVDPTVVVERSRVLDPASPDDRSPLKALLPNLAAGLVGGSGIGGGWVLVQATMSADRPSRREDVMASLDVPVPVSLGPLRGPAWLQRRRLKRHVSSPRPDLRRAVQHLRGLFTSNGAGSPAVVVVSVASDGAAALIVACTAVELVNEGKSVLVADLSRSGAISAVLSAPKGKTSSVRPGPITFPVSVTSPSGEDIGGREGDSFEHEMQEARRSAEVVLVLANVDPAIGASHLRQWATTAVAVVTSGRSDATALRSTAELLRRGGLDLVSAMLVDADPSDPSVALGRSVTSASPAGSSSLL